MARFVGQKERPEWRRLGRKMKRPADAMAASWSHGRDHPSSVKAGVDASAWTGRRTLAGMLALNRQQQAKPGPAQIRDDLNTAMHSFPLGATMRRHQLSSNGGSFRELVIGFNAVRDDSRDSHRWIDRASHFFGARTQEQSLIGNAALGADLAPSLKRHRTSPDFTDT